MASVEERRRESIKRRNKRRAQLNLPPVNPPGSQFKGSTFKQHGTAPGSMQGPVSGKVTPNTRTTKKRRKKVAKRKVRRRRI